ncbi:MAG: penicillin acylase family protein [Pirellulales bacterium]
MPPFACCLRICLAGLMAGAWGLGSLSSALAGDSTPRQLAASVTIYRDAHGVPHIDGPTDASVVFGFAYAQAEDYFWQIEDTYILCLGRYAEVYGPQGLNSDLLNRAFEITSRARADYELLEPELREIVDAYVAGLNFYLQRHPRTRPRLIKRFEPWYLLAFGRHLLLEMSYRYTRLTNSLVPLRNPAVWNAAGSNAWAVSGRRTASGHAMLLANPHQPQFGYGQFYEGHLRSGEGWNFSGATFFGSPLPSLGHNEHLGWAYTTNEPDIADVWRETFDDPHQPLAYRYDGGYRQATEWKENLKVLYGETLKERTVTFRKTHHGPIVQREDDQHFLSARIGKLEEAVMLRQLRRMVRARNLDEFQQALALRNFPLMNIIYADDQDNILLHYNGAVPRRDPGFDWTKPVDGSDRRTEWQGYHDLNELPHVLNPASGFVQNCNSSPFTTTDEGNPARHDFPTYLGDDLDLDRRRAKRSRQILRDMHDISFEDFQAAAFDTKVYWATTDLPLLKQDLAALHYTHPELAQAAEPFFKLLDQWDCVGGIDSPATSLCEAWYQELHGRGYPGETLLPRYMDNPAEKFRGLLRAAAALQTAYGDWRIPYGQTHRLQRHANVADLFSIPFDDEQRSLPCAGMPGSLGVIFTQYYAPRIAFPFSVPARLNYGVVGATYMGAYEFGPKANGATLVQFGASGNPRSPYYFDQARLLSERTFKPEIFDWAEVQRTALRKYHPGD